MVKMAAPMDHSATTGFSSEISHENDKFRVQFKRYKRRKPPPDLSEVIDFHNSVLVSQNSPKVTCPVCTMTSCRKLGLKPVDQWRCFTLQEAPGFVYLENPFQPGYQRYWIKRCLQDYTDRPNVRNLDMHHPTGGGLSLWADHIESQSRRKSLMDQLRWVTLGYHYDWSAKLYHPDRRSPFPVDLARLSAFVAGVLGYPAFCCQAGIVNYYHGDSTLGGHTDHSEFDLTAPVISYSFGQSAIFLLGGPTKETSPLAMYLRSGDIILMGGQSRMAYHAVPRILVPEGSGKLPSCLDRVEHSKPPGHSIESATEPTDCCPNPRHINGNAADSLALSACSENQAADLISAVRNRDPGISTEDHGLLAQTETAKANTSDISSEVGDGGFDAPGNCRKSGERTCEEHSPRCSAPGAVDCDCSAIHDTMRALQEPQAWDLFAKFMSKTRINISVRQVTVPGSDFPPQTMNTRHSPSISTHADLSGSTCK